MGTPKLSMHGSTGSPHGASVASLAPGDHACWFFKSRDEQRCMAAAFVGAGLRRGGRVLNLADQLPVEAVTRSLARAGIEAAASLRTGALVLMPPDRSYVQDGRFSPERGTALLRDEADRARREGYQGLWVTGEIGAGIRGAPGGDRLVEYEATVDEFFATTPDALALCQYDAAAHPPAGWVRETHSLAVDADGVLRRLHRGSRLWWLRAGGWLRIVGDVDLATRETFEALLDESTRAILGGRDLHIDVSALSFIDAGGVARLLHTADRLPPASRLILRGATPLLRRMLALVGASERPGVVVLGDPGEGADG